MKLPKTNDIVIINRFTIINDVGGTTNVTRQVKAKVTKKWDDYETGHNFAGNLLDGTDIEAAKEAGTTGYTPENYKDNPDLYSQAVKAYNTFNPRKIYFSEFDIQSEVQQ